MNTLRNPYENIERAAPVNGYPAHIRVAATASRADVNVIKGVMLEQGWCQAVINLLIQHLADYIRENDLTMNDRDEVIEHVNSILDLKRRS